MGRPSRERAGLRAASRGERPDDVVVDRRRLVWGGVGGGGNGVCIFVLFCLLLSYGFIVASLTICEGVMYGSVILASV